MKIKTTDFILFICFLTSSSSFFTLGRMLEDYKCEPQGVKLSLGDNYDKSQFYKQSSKIQYHPHDYTLTYFTELNCKQNYVIVYGINDYQLKISPNITFFRQDIDFSGDKRTKTRNKLFQIYVYEYQFNLDPSQFSPGSQIKYSCFYREEISTIYHQKEFYFFHHDKEKLKDQEFKLIWMADFDVNESQIPKYNKRRFGRDNLKIINNFINDQGRDKFISIIGGGDYAYDLNDDRGERGATFLKETEFLFSSIPFTSVAGNHELWYNMSYYKSLFRNPSYQHTQSDYYTLSFGNLIMIGLNTNRFATDKNQIRGMEQPYFDQMLDWLNKTLVWAHQNYQWIIVYSHQNIYCFENFENSSCYQNTEIFYPIENLMVQNKVDIYICGHIHAYERVHPLFQGKKKFKETDECKGKNCSKYTSPKAPVYVVDGTAGTNHYFPQDTGYEGSEEFTVTSDASLGFSIITIKNNTHLLFEHYQSDSMKLFDFFYIEKSNDGDSESSNNGFSIYIIMVVTILFLLVILFFYLRRRNILKQEEQFSDKAILMQ